MIGLISTDETTSLNFRSVQKFGVTTSLNEIRPTIYIINKHYNLHQQNYLISQ